MLARVAAILLPICPDFPIPVTITRPVHLRIISHAEINESLMREDNWLTAFVSISIVRSPDWIKSVIFQPIEVNIVFWSRLKYPVVLHKP